LSPFDKFVEMMWNSTLQSVWSHKQIK